MQVTVLSPHRDDAAFSCGLLLHSLLAAGCDVMIVNVFTVSRYAPYLVETGDDRTRQVTATRCEEDAAFAEKLLRETGADHGQLHFLDLGWLDVPLRWVMEDEGALAQASLPPEEVDTLCQELRALPAADVVLAPMALGGHIDHRLVAQAASSTLHPSILVFYEDLPYACRMPDAEGQEDSPAGGATLRETWLPTSERVSDLKQRYALCYGSQIAPSVAAEMENHASQHGNRERFVGEKDALDGLRNALRGPVITV
jgi:LmbE family N-acetylglucosaminyl deacetylase